MHYFLYSVVLVMLSGCVGIPEGIQPVNNFEVDRYLGKWYEIARLDHSFERGLNSVSAEYLVREDKGIKVINRGFDSIKKEWQEAEGKAFFVDDNEMAYLKVSFFGPFYGSYIVFELDDNYQYSFITSSNKSYLWFLSRTPHIDDKLKQHFLDQVTALGFDTKNIIFVKQLDVEPNSNMRETLSNE